MDTKAFLSFEHDYSANNQFTEYILNGFRKSLKKSEQEKLKQESRLICNRVYLKQIASQQRAGHQRKPFSQEKFDAFCEFVKELDSYARESGDSISVCINGNKTMGQVRYRTDSVSYATDKDCAQTISLWRCMFTAFSSVQIYVENDKVVFSVIEDFRREEQPHRAGPQRQIRLLSNEKKKP